MTDQQKTELLKRYKNGEIDEAEALKALKDAAFSDLGFAKIDLDRESRGGFPEVVYCEGKTAEQSLEIIRVLWERSEGNVLATRCSEETAAAVRAALPEAEYLPLPRLLTLRRRPSEQRGYIAVITAGTSDLPVAEEAAVTAEIMGNRVTRIYDAGVAGIHRLLAHEEELTSANVLIVVAGMDGALPSVVGGLIKKPLIAVPTDVGYGASFHGLAALLAMLNSCSAGVTVVNINNGFGAAVAAGRVNELAAKEK
ncbi:MAG: nickel pincer cofactor biosynthesis protein LarB [Bacillota bacterium]|jgi:NCAIR mutase (PurE)-related protein